MRSLIAIRKVGDVCDFVAHLTRARTASTIEHKAALIISDVRRNGDAAVIRYESKFGAAPPSSLRVTPQQVRSARLQVSKNELAAIRAASSRLAAAESATKRTLRATTVASSGVRTRREFVPLLSVGCYVPGGAARYPSSAIMSVVPARIAGVKRIVVASPPSADGMIDPMTVVAADICGATEIYCMGGAQAIASLAYGTRTVARVDKIVGPGGAYVSTAKSLVSNTVSTDMNAGPTELGIVADSTASPLYVALDIISQSEHSVDTTCFVSTDSAKLAREIAARVNELAPASRRSRIVCASLRNAFIAVCKTRRTALALAELLAPEHVQIMTKDSTRDARSVRSAGLILLGSTPSAASDYMLGSNHILPTMRAGRARGPLSVLDFVKMRVTAQATRVGLRRIMPHIDALAGAEGLCAHADAVRGRL